VSGRGGESKGESINGAGEAGEAGLSGEGGITIGEGIESIGGRVVSTEGRSIGDGSWSSLIRSNSILRFSCRSSGLSSSVSSSKGRPYFFLILPVMLWMAVPVEFALRARVVIMGEAFTVVLVEAGEGGASVCAWERRSMLGLNMRGIERRFSSTVEAGDGERGQSRADMEQLR
jgi:hypothetical protein